ncbi:MAG TPA: J domain-containing protein [Burkholderiaceae bacterium]|nr:J domain-containing protein [Burkholderiaceae bacterium]
MPTLQAHTLRIATTAAQAALSADQRKFNTLIQKIEDQRRILADWQEGASLYRERHAREYAPLWDNYRALNLELLRALDRRLDGKGLSRADRALLQDVVCDLADALMRGDGEQAELEAIYNRHSDIDHGTLAQETQAAMKAMVEDAFGMDLGDDVDLDSPEEIARRVEQEMQARQARAEQAAQEARARRAARKKSTPQSKHEVETHEASQSIRAVYRQLASALHPDRAPDAQERARKTVLMQRVNLAYGREDLLALLELQLEIEQIDPKHLNNLAQDRLKHYNRVLARQLAELQREIADVEQGFKMEFQLDPFERVAPATLMRTLARQLKALQYSIHQMRVQQQGLQDDRYFKRWLKEQRL